jgi:hypothetical protein
MSVDDIGRLRVLEIGEFRLFKGTLPATTVRLSTARRREPAEPGERRCSPAAFVAALRDLRAGRYDLVVCYPHAAGIRRPRDGAVVGLARGVITLLGRFHRFGYELLRVPPRAPLAVLDYADEPFIGRHAYFLLERATRYFKRELPLDGAKALLGPSSPSPSLPAVHRSALYRRHGHKLAPISVGVPAATLADLPAAPPNKVADIFFAGSVAHGGLRTAGWAALERLRTRGVHVDLSPGGVPRPEYLRRMAAARLAWSPEGFGWDCFRHYEALAAGAVPVISRAGVERYCPLVEGTHCLYYDPEGDDLERVVTAALAEPVRLAAMAAAGREHVMRHFTHRALCRHVATACGAFAAKAPR